MQGVVLWVSLPQGILFLPPWEYGALKWMEMGGKRESIIYKDERPLD